MRTCTFTDTYICIVILYSQYMILFVLLKIVDVDRSFFIVWQSLLLATCRILKCPKYIYMLYEYSKLRVAYIILWEFRIIMRSDSARYSCICVKLSTVARINRIIANTCCLTGYFKTEKQQEIKVFAAFDFQQYAKLCYLPESIFCITK